MLEFQSQGAMSFINYKAVKRNFNKSKLSNRKATLEIKKV